MSALGYPVTGSPETLAVYDGEGAQAGGGYRGTWDADIRLQEMDREGIAVEFVYFGDHRASAMFYNVFNRWPNTRDWLRDVFRRVPENELRLILGGNTIRTLGLPRAQLDNVACRVGPTVDDILAGPDVDAALIGHFDLRDGYLRPPEGDGRIPVIAGMVRDDLAGMAARGGGPSCVNRDIAA